MVDFLISVQGIKTDKLVNKLFNDAAEISETVVCFKQVFYSAQVTACDEADGNADKTEQKSDACDDAENFPNFTH